MSQLICPVCGEEWFLDVIHEEVAARRQDATRGPSQARRATFTTVVREFTTQGCGVALRASCGRLTCEPSPATAELCEMVRMIYATLGDDIDGACNEIEDYLLLEGP